MKQVWMAAMALSGGLLFAACAVPVEIEMKTEDVAEVEEQVTRGKCEDAVDEGADVWQRFCGALHDRPAVIQQCRKEHSNGRGAGKNKCSTGTCKDACLALDHRWQTYCEERIPPRWNDVCTEARDRGYNVCIDWCRRRPLDDDDNGATRSECNLQNESSL